MMLAAGMLPAMVLFAGSTMSEHGPVPIVQSIMAPLTTCTGMMKVLDIRLSTFITIISARADKAGFPWTSICVFRNLT
jgi:hypothetical protein